MQKRKSLWWSSAILFENPEIHAHKAFSHNKYTIWEWKCLPKNSQSKSFHKFLFICISVKPISINITSKPKQFASDMEYSINCEVEGSVPETDIRWMQNNRPFTRGKVCIMQFSINYSHTFIYIDSNDAQTVQSKWMWFKIFQILLWQRIRDIISNITSWNKRKQMEC